MRVLKSFLVNFCLFNCAFGFNGFTSLYNTHDEPYIDSDDYKSTIQFTVKEKWIQQKLDHFNLENSVEWKMRYLENDRFFVPGGPIFIFCGGEWEISPGYISAGLMFEMAKEMNGTMFYTEHRYYGKSRPTENTSTENLKFLTVEQALADLAHFIESVKSTDDLKNSGVILVGASYSATLVTWARLKYPELVTGAWSSSAPLLAKVDFFEYNEIMTESIRIAGGEKCLRRFENAFKQLEDFIKSSEPKALAKIEKDFKLCEPLKLNRDVPHFLYEMSDTVAGLVQSHRFGDIERACKFLTVDSASLDDAAALGAWVTSKSSKKCLNMNYANAVKKFTNITWGSEANKQLRQWTWQTCDQFGWFQTGNSVMQSFGSDHPRLAYFTKICADFFDNKFDSQSIHKNVDEINEKFGGLNPNLTNVYSTHGQLDPWRAMGLQVDLNPEAPAVVIESYSHVPDLLTISKSDTPLMQASKKRVKYLVRRWLGIEIE